MAYKVRAVSKSHPPAAGNFRADTAKEALEKARNLRGQGLSVTIRDERENLVNEEDLRGRRFLEKRGAR
jgi:hypothetical protein